MSLILTTNTSVNGGNGNAPLNTGLNRPYDYINFLTNTFEVEPDSEVAVQSVKINKEGNIAVNRNNNQFYVYLGDRSAEMEDTTSTPIHTFLNVASEKTEEVNVNTLTQFTANAINRGMAHPDMMPNDSTNTSGTEVSVERDTDQVFKGYDIKINYGISASLVDSKASMDFVDSITDPDYAGLWNPANQRVTKQSASGSSPNKCEMINTSMPLSQCGGQFTTNYEHAGGLWAIGLTRYLDQNQLFFQDQNFGYFKPEGQSYYDYVAKSVFDASVGRYYLRLYHSVMDEVRGDEEFISLKEFEYWSGGPASGSLTGPYEIFDDPADYASNKDAPKIIAFKIENERMIVQVTDTNGNSKIIADGGQANKTHNLKPTCSTTKFLYPKIKVTEDNKYVTTTTYNGVKPNGFVYGNLRDTASFMDGTYVFGVADFDWWCKLYFRNQCEDYGREVDLRNMFHYNNADPYFQHGLNASGAFKNSASDVGVALILADDRATDTFGYRPTPQANATDLLGFEDNPVLDVPNASTTTTETYKSTNIPQQVSTNSLFVRLNNFLQRTINGQTNGVSKILYHLPRFDNSGVEFGGLFYEPSERVYVKLHNTEKMRVNELAVSLVNPDETLAENLTGKTIVMFHIRKSRS